MSELTAAMQAALDSVAARRRPSDAPPATGPGGTDVQLRDGEQRALPPVVSHRPEPATFAQSLRATSGPVAAAVWATIREAVVLVGLFWVCAILLAFVEVEGAVHVPGVGDATVITVALVAATVLRGILAAASRSGRALERTRR